MKKWNLVITMISAAFIIQSCSKEARMERMLYKKDGTWNISTMSYTLLSVDDMGVETTVNGTASNAGTFTFDKEGNGSYSFVVDGDTHARDFTYSVSNESVGITKISQTINYVTFEVEQVVVLFTGSKEDKNKITIQGSETVQSTSDTEDLQKVLTVTMTLDKE